MEEMRAVLDDDAFDFRYELSISGQPSTLSDSDHIVKFSAKHSTVVRVKAQLDQVIDSLNVLGIYELIKANPHAMHKLLVSKPVPMASDFIMDLFQTRFSAEGSNRREDEEPVMMYWVHFLEMIEVVNIAISIGSNTTRNLLLSIGSEASNRVCILYMHEHNYNATRRANVVVYRATSVIALTHFPPRSSVCIHSCSS